ncbi:hypothetical protein [Streptomyces hydrogenans]
MSDLGYRVAIAPDLVVGYVGETVDTDAWRLAAARQTSAIAAKAHPGTSTSTPTPDTPPPSAGLTSPAPTETFLLNP